MSVDVKRPCRVAVEAITLGEMKRNEKQGRRFREQWCQLLLSINIFTLKVTGLKLQVNIVY